MIVWQSNGFIIIRDDNIQYKGVDNDAWPLQWTGIQDARIEFIHKKIMEYCHYYNESFAALLTDPSEVFYYQTKCASENIPIRIIYCETKLDKPKFDIQLAQRYAKRNNFMGYDYAEKIMDYHSCIKNELLYHPNLYKKTAPSLLNKNGLFCEYQDVINFKTERERIRSSGYDEYFEIGDFIVFKLYFI